MTKLMYDTNHDNVNWEIHSEKARIGFHSQEQFYFSMIKDGILWINSFVLILTYE